MKKLFLILIACLSINSFSQFSANYEEYTNRIEVMVKNYMLENGCDLKSYDTIPKFFLVCDTVNSDSSTIINPTAFCVKGYQVNKNKGYSLEYNFDTSEDELKINWKKHCFLDENKNQFPKKYLIWIIKDR